MTGELTRNEIYAFTARGLAQLGSAPRSGRGGREFKSPIPDNLWIHRAAPTPTRARLKRRAHCRSVICSDEKVLSKSRERISGVYVGRLRGERRK